MDSSAFTRSLANDAPPAGLSLPLEALWWDAKGDWARAHGLIDHLETHDAMAVHAYLHRKQGEPPTPATGRAAPPANTAAPPTRPRVKPCSKPSSPPPASPYLGFRHWTDFVAGRISSFWTHPTWSSSFWTKSHLDFVILDASHLEFVILDEVPLGVRHSGRIPLGVRHSGRSPESP
jgi:hypothetical protein